MVINTPGRAAGNLNTMTPEKAEYLQQAAKLEYGAQGRGADRISGAMAEQEAPLDERAKYYADLAAKEERDQGGRNEQNRQRMEDLDRETKELRAMEVDPQRRLKSGAIAPDIMATIFGGIGQGFLRRAGIEGGNQGLELAKHNAAQDIALQQDAIGQKKGYIDQVRQAIRDQREMQGDQVASQQRRAALMQQSTGAKLDKAGIGVAIQEAISRGDMGQAQALMKLAERQAAEQHYVAAQGGGQIHRMFINGEWHNLSEKEYNARALKMEDKGVDTASTIATNNAKASAEGKAKDDEARMVDVGGGKYYKARSTEEAIALDKERRMLEQQQLALNALRDQVDGPNAPGWISRAANQVTGGVLKPKSVSDAQTKQEQLRLTEAQKGGGIVTPADLARAGETTGNQLSANPFANQRAKLDAMQADLNRRKELFDRGRDMTTRAPEMKPR